VSFVCGVIQHRRRSPLDRGRWSWPFGRVELEANELRAYAPVFLGRFALHMPYSDITAVMSTPARWGGRLRLRRRNERGDVTIVTLGGGYRRIGDVLRAKGIGVEERS
jgi:hypothetical protein